MRPPTPPFVGVARSGVACARTLIVEDVTLCYHAEAMTYLRGESNVRVYQQHHLGQGCRCEKMGTSGCVFMPHHPQPRAPAGVGGGEDQPLLQCLFLEPLLERQVSSTLTVYSRCSPVSRALPPAPIDVTPVPEPK